MRPDERRRQVQMSVRFIDAVISSIRAIAEKRVFNDDCACMAGNIPAVRIGSGDGKGAASAIRGAKVINILGEFVQRVTAWRRAAHYDFQHRLPDIGKRGANFRFVMDCVRELQFIADRLLGPQWNREKREDEICFQTVFLRWEDLVGVQYSSVANEPWDLASTAESAGSQSLAAGAVLRPLTAALDLTEAPALSTFRAWKYISHRTRSSAFANRHPRRYSRRAIGERDAALRLVEETTRFRAAIREGVAQADRGELILTMMRLCQWLEQQQGS